MIELGRVRHGRRRRLGFAAVLLATALIGAACSSDDQGTPTAEESLETLEPLDSPVDFVYGLLPVQSPVYIALERGYFEDVGLNVELEFLQSGSEVLPALASGNIDAAASSPAAALFNAAASGVPVNIVADAGSYVEGHSVGAFVVRQELIDSGEVTELDDLAGRTLAATAEGTAMDMFNHILLDDAGLTPEDVELAYMGFPDMMAALASGQVDGGQLTEPFITRGEQEGFLTRWIPHTELEPGGQQTVLMYTPRLIEDDVEEGQRFMVAYLRACRDYNAAMGPDAVDQDEIVGIMSEYLDQDEQLIREAIPTYLEPNGRVNEDSLEFRQQFWVDRDLVGNPVDIDDVVDTRFAEFAVSQLGEG